MSDETEDSLAKDYTDEDLEDERKIDEIKASLETFRNSRGKSGKVRYNYKNCLISEAAILMKLSKKMHKLDGRVILNLDRIYGRIFRLRKEWERILTVNLYEERGMDND